VIDLQDQVQQYDRHDLTGPDRIYFDLHDTTLNHALAGKTEVGDSPWLMRVRVAQPTPGITRVVLDTKNSPECSVSLKTAPYRLEVQLHGPNTAVQPKAKVDLFSPLTPSMSSSAKQTSSGAATRAAGGPEKSVANPHIAKFRVALDAGHGGWDEGTIGRKGLMEKDLALDIVARLGKLVTNRLGAEVVYTRRDDTYVPLEKRAEIANLSQADFFVSIHANYSDIPTARGVETYYSNSYSSLNARIPETDNTVQQVNWTNVDIREKALQSQQLATSVQNALYDRLAKQNHGISDRGIKKASYVVLTGTTMPAVLAEVSFVSSPADETNLKRSAYRQWIAEALYKGIARFVAAQHKVTMASAATKPVGR
jgi:N-acetylmuramoyl-L-alanine amidase